MKQSRRLQPICDVKQREEDAAAKILAIASQEVSEQKQKLLDLEGYQSEYDQNFSTTSSQGISAQQMKEYHIFMNNLSQVLVQQKAAVSGMEKNYEDKKRQWLAARNRVKAINKMKVKYQKQESVYEEKKEQKEQDDRGARKVR